jgi:hypothetical protein
MAVPNTLGLDDDLDSVELLLDLEASFGVKFPNEEAEACLTVGDVFQLVQRHVQRPDAIGAGCATAMAFYRLRRALARDGSNPRLAPTTALEEIPSPSPKATFRRILEAYPDIRLPRLSLSAAGLCGLALLVSAFALIAVFAASPRWSALSACPALATALGALLMRYDRGRFPRGCRTLGYLARKVAGLNFVALTAAGCYRLVDVWRAFVEVLTEHSSLPQSEIQEHTLILESQMRAR